MTPYSVLIPVYAKENPAFFRESLDSMAGQTLAPEEVVVICDGPLTPGLERVLEEFSAEHPGLTRLFRLSQSEGLGRALAFGVAKCSCELIARMDSDDISVPERCAMQVAALERSPDAVIVGSQIHEFESSPEETGVLRALPCGDDEIRAFSGKRNPFNHMSVMLRRSAVLAAGGYLHMPFFEDYWLWMRLLREGKGLNLPEALVHARTGPGMIARRGGPAYVGHCLRFQRALLDGGYITRPEFLRNCLVRTAAGIVPGPVRRWIYGRFLRK